MSVNIKENDALNGIAKLIPASNITLSSLPDTSITLPQAEQSLGYDEASGRWINYNVRISVYYSDDFRGLNISCTKGQTTITKTAPMDGNAVVFYVNEKGTWTVSANIGATEYTDTVVVTSFGVTYPAQLVTSSSETPEGATVEPTDDIQTWLACANLDKPYTTLDAVLADRETFETLIADSNACDYMARSTTWALQSGQIPTMTSNTTPSGTASANVIYGSGYEAWRAFNLSETNGWIARTNTLYAVGDWLEYDFDTDVTIGRVSVGWKNSVSANSGISYKIQEYNGSTWEDVSEEHSVSFIANAIAWEDVILTTPSNRKHRLYITSVVGSNANGYGFKMQFYTDADITTNQDVMSLIGKYDYCSTALLSNATWLEAIANSDYFEYVLNVKVPTMTSNTTPSGEVIASGSNSSGSHPYWHAFDKSTSTYWINTTGNPNYIGYDFGYDVEIHKVVLTNLTGTGVKLQGYNESDWVDIDDSILADSGTKTYIVSASTTYQKFRLVNATQLYEAQFYGRASSEVLVPLVPTMTSNTTPSGQCIANSSYNTNTTPWHAFDRNNNTSHYTAVNVSTSEYYLGYIFPSPVKINKVVLSGSSYGTSIYYDVAVYGGNDLSNLTKLSSSVKVQATAVTEYETSFENSNKYSIYVLKVESSNVASTHVSGQALLSINEIQFYQRTVQTNVVHSSANDTIYYLDEGSPVIVATTNSDGDGVFDLSSLEDKEYTFYSSVAKDPSNLSNDFSKTIRITKTPYGGTTEMYVLPDNDNMLYWFGLEYKSISLDRNSNGGYVNKNTNNISIGHYLGTAGNVSTVYVTDKQILSNKVKAIISYGDTSSYFQNLGVTTNIAQTFGGATFPIQTSITPKTAMDVYEVDTSSQAGNSFYVGYSTNCYPSATYIHAMWLE